MNLLQMKYFVTIVEEGNISKAAKKLFMAQPPLSYQLKQLEKELNCQLLIRNQHSISLTKEGHIFYEKCLSMLYLEEQTKREIAFSLKESMFLKIGTISSVTSLFSQCICNYHFKNPNVVINIYESNTYQLIDMLMNNQIDCAVVRTPFANDKLEIIELKSEDLYYVSQRKMFNKDIITINDLEEQPIIIYRRWAKFVVDQFEKNNIKCKPTIIADDARTCLELVKHCNDGAIVPESIAVECDVYKYRIEIPDFSSKICLVYIKDRVNPLIIKDIIEACNKEIKKSE